VTPLQSGKSYWHFRGMSINSHDYEEYYLPTCDTTTVHFGGMSTYFYHTTYATPQNTVYFIDQSTSDFNVFFYKTYFNVFLQHKLTTIYT
jgi:hypothetical protein